jgi:tRNA A-37 threonylcarbamoyl transferase component Bud32
VDETLFAKTTTPARARKIWENAHGLALRGIDTPKLWTWDRTTVTGEWIDSVDLHEYILRTYGTLPPAERKDFLFRLARLVRRMHDRGAYHGDLKAGNVLVGDGRIAIIDLDRVRFSLDVSEKDRLFNLAQLNAAVTPPLTKTDRLRFLDAYMGRCTSLRPRRGDWIRAIMAATVARKHRWPGSR